MREDYNFNYVKCCINNEGFDYCFNHYSDFKDEINDEEFHKLRMIWKIMLIKKRWKNK